LLQEDNALALEVTSQQDEDSPWGDARPADAKQGEIGTLSYIFKVQSKQPKLLRPKLTIQRES
jgi:hypothetical protein